MRRFPRLLLALVSLLPSAAIAATAWPPQSPPREEWHNMLMNGQKVGHMHVLIEAEGRDAVAVTLISKMRVQRVGETVEMASTVRMIEGFDGVARSAVYEEAVAQNQLRTEARVVGDSLLLVSTGLNANDRRALYLGGVDLVFPWRADRMLANAYAVGDTLLVYQSFIPEMGTLDTFRVRLLGEEELWLGGKRYRALHTETWMGSLPSAPNHEWRDLATGKLLQSRIDMMGMVQETEATTPGDAQTPSLAYTFDVILQTLLKTKRRIPRPRLVDELTLRVLPRAGSVLPTQRLDWGEQQSLEASADGEQLLRVRRLEVGPSSYTLPYSANDWRDELGSSLLIQANNPEMVAAARRVIGEEKDPLVAARQLNQWVFRSISKKSFGVGFASALETLRRKEGDCTEHAMLLAGLARAAGIPARVVSGLIYVRGAFGYHMWTEVFNGVWVPLDPAFGLDVIDATHIKIATQALSEASTAGAFVPLLDVMGKFDLDVVSYRSRGKLFSGPRPKVELREGWILSPEHLLRFQVPPGWEPTPDDKLPVEFLQVFYPRDQFSLAQITVRAFVVNYDFTLRATERSIAAAVGGLDQRRRLKVGGVDAVRLEFTDPNDELPRVSVLLLDGDTYFAFTLENPDAKEIELFDAMVASVRFDRDGDADRGGEHAAKLEVGR
jgi:transglutaminase-like putative cysteine protease